MIENSLLNMSDREFDRAQGCFKPSCMACDDKHDCDEYQAERIASIGIDAVILAMAKERRVSCE